MLKFSDSLPAMLEIILDIQYLQQSQGDTQGKVAEGKALVSTAQAVVKQEQARVQEARALLEQARVDSEAIATPIWGSKEPKRNSALTCREAFTTLPKLLCKAV